MKLNSVEKKLMMKKILRKKFIIIVQPIPISNDFFYNLANCLEVLENRIRNDEDTYDVLEKIINLTSTIDGNGYYLKEKGIPVYVE